MFLAQLLTWVKFFDNSQIDKNPKTQKILGVSL